VDPEIIRSQFYGSLSENSDICISETRKCFFVIVGERECDWHWQHTFNEVSRELDTKCFKFQEEPEGYISLDMVDV
jgi:hypothetical protein